MKTSTNNIQLSTISADNVKNVLSFSNGVTFAGITTKTPVTTAAKYKGLNIVKTSKSNIQLFNNLKSFTDVYSNAVKKTAGKLNQSEAVNVDDFIKSDNYFIHDSNAFSLVKHKEKDSYYLYAIFNDTLETVYTLNGEIIDKQQVADYLTPSAKKALMDNTGIVHNVTNNINHSVIVRTIKLENIVELKSNTFILSTTTA